MSAPTRKRPAAKRSPKAAAKPTPPSNDDAAIEAADAALAELEQLEDSPLGPDGEIRPVVIGKKGKKGTEMVHIFTLDDVDYFVPRNLGPARILAFQRDLNRYGRETAIFNLALNVLGKNLDALAQSPNTDEEDLTKVLMIIAALAYRSLGKVVGGADPS